MTMRARRESEMLLYTAPDGAVKVGVRFQDETAWLPQKALAEPFGVRIPAINRHLRNIYESSELGRAAAISKMEIAQSEGGREVTREVEYLSDFDRAVEETRRLQGTGKPKALTSVKKGKKSMSPDRTQAPSRGPKETIGIEWIGGTARMPAYVTGEGEPYRPEMLLWMGADGAILGSTVVRPGELLPMAGASLESAMAQPMHGPPHRPARVRVASPDLAGALRAAHPGLDVVSAPTPELDEVLAGMRESMGDGPAIPSYLSPGVEPDAMAAFFRAAAALFRARPWNRVPDDQSLFSVTIEQLEVRDAAMSIMGQMGQNFGFVLFPGIEEFEAYLDAADFLERGETPELPPHFALTFERRADLAPELRKQVARHGWKVAGARAYPWLIAVDPDLVTRPPTAKEVAMAEAIAMALTSIMAEETALLAAWDGGEPVYRTSTVHTHEGGIQITIGTPYMRAPAGFEPSGDILARLAALERDSDEIDPRAHARLENELTRSFAASPEAKNLEDLHACHLVMDLAAGYLGQTVATLDSSGLREVLFELIPRKVSIDHSEARWIVGVTRALYAFLKREFGLGQADSCLRVLGDGAVPKLEAALSDSGNFGMAKSLVMAGRDAGFDVESPEGMEAWMRSIQGRPLPSSIPVPHFATPPRPTRKAAKAKKGKRKAARKARKRSR